MPKSQPNLYRVGKAILADGLVVNNWWLGKDLSKDNFPFLTQELEKAFGKKALIKGVQNGQNQRQEIPEIVADYAKS
jgi:hypothetical protein